MDIILELLKNLHEDIDFEECDGLVTDGVLDSFDIVSLIGDISDQFDVEITADKITPENFNSAESIWNLVSDLMEE